ncbi:MAG: SET domain-containing protein-lysine N-methyltransferase [Myxococcales bacterium]|nr:MAG: SET domain-containing protein-lysine N-methyltransferase [Myxococcales bacterium]
MLHPDTELCFISPEIGYGVVATRDIPRGTITWVLDPLDQILSPRRLDLLDRTHAEILETYTWRDAKGRRIMCWDFGRYMNHHCDANTFAIGGVEFEIAVQDIPAGVQISSDYGALNLERPFACRCGSEQCRGTIYPEDFERLASRWDAKIQEAVVDIDRTVQPLFSHLSEEDKRFCQSEHLPGNTPSILAHRYRAKVQRVNGKVNNALTP